MEVPRTVTEVQDSIRLDCNWVSLKHVRYVIVDINQLGMVCCKVTLHSRNHKAIKYVTDNYRRLS